MKPEYRERALENLNSITKRTQILTEVIEGKRNANDAELIHLIKEINRLVEMTTSVVELS